MIERILENWLDKSSERSYQLPFCYLLVKQGKTIIHLTRHCAMEHGKDVIAVDKEGIAHVYQLKGVNGGKLKLRDWQGNILGQVMQLVHTPVVHPSVNTDKHHISYLVLNGEIEEEVFNAIKAMNDDWEKKGFPERKLQTIVKGQILQWSHEIKDQIIPSELKEFNTLLELQLDSGKGFLDKAKFSALISSIFRKDSSGDPEFRRLISSGALLCSLALSTYQKHQNHTAIVEGWMIYLAEVFGFVERNNLNPSFYKLEIALIDQIIYNALMDLLDDAIFSDNPQKDDLMQDVFVFQHRQTILAGLLGYLGARIDKTTTEYANLTSKIDKYIHDNKKQMSIWGESAIPYLVNIYWFYQSLKDHTKAVEILQSAFAIALKFAVHPNQEFTNIYLSAEDTILLLNDEKKHTIDIDLVTNTRHVTEQLLHLMTINDQKETLKKFWKDIVPVFTMISSFSISQTCFCGVPPKERKLQDLRSFAGLGMN